MTYLIVSNVDTNMGPKKGMLGRAAQVIKSFVETRKMYFFFGEYQPGYEITHGSNRRSESSRKGESGSHVGSPAPRNEKKCKYRHDVVLPPWAKSAEEFVYLNRQALESDYV